MADTGSHMSSSKKTNSVKLKYTTFIPNDVQKIANKGEDDISLQEAFRKYRKAKQKQLKHAKRLRRRNLLRKADPKVMAALRRKFVQQAKKYFGYPYAKKYWPPESQEYRSKLFLDCCGLVRQVMRDLADDFGFSIGPWNQAYMYDTLPITVQSEKDMRPGDLVFISATYFNPKSKKQPHNMTHVEIWLGDGPKTIGARWNNGKVQVFDSYRFTAKSYYDETYHFKSIDTWLKGLCKSHCKLHKWKRRKFNPTKKSVFSIDQQQTTDDQNNQQDEAAEDDENDITNFIMRGNSFCCQANPPGEKTLPGSQKNKTDNLKASTASSSTASSSPASESATPDIQEDIEEILADEGTMDLDDDGSDIDSDLESTNEDVDDDDNDDDMELFIDAGDAEDDCNDESEDKSTSICKDFEQDNVGDASAIVTKSGKLVDLDNRGIYLRDILGNEEAKCQVTDTDAVHKILDINDASTACSQSQHDKGDGHADYKQNVEKINENNSSISDNAKIDIALVEDIQSLSVTDASENVLNQNDDTSNAQLTLPTDPLNTNQNAFPKSEKKNRTQPCPSPAISSRLSPDYSASNMSNASCTNEKKNAVQSIGSDDSIAGSQSTVTVQGDNKEPDGSDVTEETGSSESGKKKGGKKSPGNHTRSTKLPSCSLPTNMTPTFYVGGGNGVSLVDGPLSGLGWKRITDKFDERFKLKWVECKTKINYGAFREGDQMVNHLPNSHLLTNKLGLLNSLKEYERVTLSTKGRLPRLKMSDFHPETYKLDEKSDRELFLDVYKDGEIWICKPIGMNQGKGIFLIRTKEAILQLLDERDQKKQQQQKPGKPLMNRIVQRYIMNPLLLDGRKFDVRTYMLIASTVPFLVLYHKGYVRLSCLKYDTDDQNLGVHLTNQFVQKKDPAYKDLKEETAWSMDRFNDYINNEIRPHSHVEFEEDWVFNSFTKQMQKIMIHCFNSVKHKLQARLGFFDLFGLDFMVDTDMKTWLIEMNVNPCMSRKCSAMKEVLPGLIRDYLYVSIEAFEKSKKHLPLMPLQSLKNFTILYCGTRPNTILPRQSRSVSPVKDNTADRPKYVPTGALRRSGSPTRTQHRSSIHSTPLYTAKNDNGNKEASANAAHSSSAKSTVISANNKKTRADTKAGVTSNKTGKEEKKEEKSSQGETVVDSNKTLDNAEDSKKATETEVKTVPKSHVVVDTLLKTNDSLNEAANVLGRLSQSLNQTGLAESLLEEVRLKMTHAEPASISPNAEKPSSGKQKRENLERGN